MKKTAAFALLVGMLLLSPTVNAITSRVGNAEDLGVGFAMGQPMGATAKYWLNSTTAVDAFAGYHFNSNFDVHADYLLHTFSSFDVTSGRLPFYLGVGGRVNLGNSSDFWHAPALWLLISFSHGSHRVLCRSRAGGQTVVARGL